MSGNCSICSLNLANNSRSLCNASGCLSEFCAGRSPRFFPWLIAVTLSESAADAGFLSFSGFELSLSTMTICQLSTGLASVRPAERRQPAFRPEATLYSSHSLPLAMAVLNRASVITTPGNRSLNQPVKAVNPVQKINNGWQSNCPTKSCMAEKEAGNAIRKWISTRTDR